MKFDIREYIILHTCHGTDVSILFFSFLSWSGQDINSKSCKPLENEWALFTNYSLFAKFK